MKILKTLLICLLLITTTSTFAGDEKFIAAIEKGIAMLNAAHSADKFQLAANHFERIVSAQPKEWLPVYYAAYANLHTGILSSDKDKRDDFYDKALNQLKLAENVSKNNSEIFALEGYVILMKVALSPMLRSMSLTPDAKELLAKAKTIDPANPRSFLIDGQHTLYTPEIFGGGKAKAKPILEISKKKYAAQKPKSSIDPQWGKARLEELLKMCEG